MLALLAPMGRVSGAVAQVSRFVRPTDRAERENVLVPARPTARIASTTRAAAFEDPNVVFIEQEKACATSAPESKEPLVVDGQKPLPAYATAGTVFLNGWELRYLSKDHKVAQMETRIFNIRLQGNTLKWGAVGRIRDKNFDDAYEWCYHYVIVAWNQAVIDALAQDDLPTTSVAYSAQNANEDTALVTAAGFKGDLRFIGKAVVTALPEGFWFDWGGENFQQAFPQLDDADQEDHSLLQVAYSMGPSTLLIELEKTYDTPFAQPLIPTNASRVNDGFVSWESQAIFKDNAAKRKFMFLEKFSALAGNSVAVIHRPFTVRPVEETGAIGCITSKGKVKTTDHAIENIPFQYAWPVLTGWDLSFDCDDEQVTQIGVWLHDINYAAGVLRYKVSSILRDKDSDPDFGARYGVSVLGLNSIGSAPPVPLRQPSR
jgi:hypothetical protein